METVEEADLLERYRVAMGRHGHHPVVLHSTLGGALSVVALLQLALRHPGAQASGTAAIGRTFIEQVRTAALALDPLFAEVVAAGDDPAHDQPPAPSEAGDVRGARVVLGALRWLVKEGAAEVAKRPHCALRVELRDLGLQLDITWRPPGAVPMRLQHLRALEELSERRDGPLSVVQGWLANALKEVDAAIWDRSRRPGIEL